MATSLYLAASDPRVEAVYTWLEQHPGLQVQLWGHESARRAALLAYSDGGSDGFGWSNWASKADDPSLILADFDRLELVVDDSEATALNATFLGVFTAAPNAAFG
jgi:hypothetical protein